MAGLELGEVELPHLVGRGRHHEHALASLGMLATFRLVRRSHSAATNGLRRRRRSLHYKRTGSLAEVTTLLGDSKRVAAEHYVYAVTDYREVDRTIALARAKGEGARA